MIQSIWPFDHAHQDSYSAGKSLDEISCFLICPANPAAFWDDLFAHINDVCTQLGARMGVAFRCRRAIDILSAGVIHPEIWQDIRSADLVIADISGNNANVMFELGVASAWLDKDRVIIIREAQTPEEQRPFDINPARQIDYTRSPTGFQALLVKLAALIQEGIARAPFEQEATATFALPVALDLTSEADIKALWGPSGAHRRMLPNQGLEFGSLYNFRYGWLSLGNVVARNVRAKGQIRFATLHTKPPYPAWLGVMLRSQGYMANSGHLALLRANGVVAVRQEFEDGRPPDVDIGKINNFDPTSSQPIPFDVAINETSWTIRIGSVEHSTNICDMPYVFSQGRIVVEGQFCWVCLRSLEVSELS